MRLDYAFLAKAVDLSPDGVFGALGAGFNTVNAASFPVHVPSMALLVRVLARPDECDREHRIRFEFVELEKGVVVAQAETPFTPAPNQVNPALETSFSTSFNMVALEFTAPADYELRILGDGERLGALRLQVLSTTGQVGAGQ